MIRLFGNKKKNKRVKKNFDNRQTLGEYMKEKENDDSCGTCNGTGKDLDQIHPCCQHCGGTGKSISG